VKGDYAAAIPLFRRATELDPNFAMAYARMGTCYFNLALDQRAVENIRKAYEFRDRGSDREKFYIASHYQDFVAGNLDQARTTYETWARTYPRDDVPPANLSVIYQQTGDMEKSLYWARESLKISPDATAYSNLASGYVFLGRLDEAKATIQEAESTDKKSPFLNFNTAEIAFLQHNPAVMEQALQRVADYPGYEDQPLSFRAGVAGFYGKLATSRDFARRAVDSAIRFDAKDRAAWTQAVASVREQFVGNSILAVRQAHDAVTLANTNDTTGVAAVVLALAGETIEANRLRAELSKRDPEDTLVQVQLLPMIQASLFMHENKPAQAIDALVPSIPYEIGAVQPGFRLVPIYLRGLALLQSKQGSAATVEFKKIIDHDNLTLNSIIGPLSRLGLARSYVLSGDASKARAAYQDFFAIWKDADPDIPILIQAKSEYAKLQ
jgi:tetratricopeptide (TPR) repeat protein